MIAELFYPKALKEIIRKLEDENNLRREPLDKINKGISGVALISLLLFLLIIYSYGFYPGLFVLMIGIVIVRCILYAETKLFAVMYYGEKQPVLVNKIKINEFLRIAPNANVLCKTMGGERNIILKRIPCPNGTINGIEAGKKILVYCNQKGKDAVLSSYEYLDRYCLRKDLMQEQENEND